MLGLSRKAGEGVTLTLEDGRTIRVVVLAFDRNRVQIGFEADASIKITRDELLHQAPPADARKDGA